MSHFTVTKKSFYELFVYLDDKDIYKYSHYQRVTGKKIKKIQNFYFMQQQNNYSKLRYSNSVYNKAGRRGYHRASKVPVGASKFYFKIREFRFKIYFELFF